MAKKKTIKKTSERKEGFFKIIVAIVSGIVLELWGYVIAVIAIINWLGAIFLGKRNKDLAMFCEYWNTEVYRYFRYLTGVSNERPFPFTNVQSMSKYSK